MTGVGNLQYEALLFTRGLEEEESEYEETDEEADGDDASGAIAEDFSDPITSGRVDAGPDCLIRDMRAYFLRVLENGWKFS
jgi:hypothetical protein